MTEEGPFLLADLAGCQVVTEAGEILGVFKDVISSRAHDIWIVDGRREYLIPARKEIILSVDIAAKKISVRLPPGLREVYES